MIDATDTPISTRPEAPIRSAPFLAPLLGWVVGFGVAGLAGANGLAWGALAGAVVFGVLAWAGVTKQPADAIVLVGAGAVALRIFNGILADRSTVISWPRSLAASVGWLLFGLAIGWVLVRHRPTINRSAVAWIGIAFAFAAFLALQMGTAVGYVEALRAREIDAGAIQILTTGFFVQAGMVIAAIGGGVALSFYVGNGVLASAGASGVVTVLAFNQTGFSITELRTQFGRLGALAGDFWPPDFTWPKTIGQPEAVHIIEPFIETIQIAVMGATFGCLVALPLAFLASRPTTPGMGAYWLAKTFMNVIRTIPDLFWAVLFATAVGFGSPFAGALAMLMFSISIMAKLLSETVDAIDLGPLEAADASGARHWQMIQYAAFPQVAPNYVAYALYIFELNIRASVVIGIVGAGGIGRLLDERRNFFQWDQVMAIVLVIFVAVILIELFSVWVRKYLV